MEKLNKKKPILLTKIGEKQEISLRSQDLIALFSDGRCIVNENFLDDHDIIQFISLWKSSGLIKKIIYDSSYNIQKLYKNNNYDDPKKIKTVQSIPVKISRFKKAATYEPSTE